MTAFPTLLEGYRAAAATHREADTQSEELTVCYFKNEPAYREFYREVFPYVGWAERQRIDQRDAGIGRVAESFTGEMHAIRGKLYAPDHVPSPISIASSGRSARSA